MCAQVLRFDPEPASRGADTSTGATRELGCREHSETARLQFWVGSSGARYIHTVHSLLACPELPPVNYLLVRRDRDGNQAVLAAGHADHDAASLNLAEIRRLGATLGANEVHVHMLAACDREAKVVAYDLRSAHIRGAAEEPGLTH